MWGKFVTEVILSNQFLLQVSKAYLFRNMANLLFIDQDNMIYHSSIVCAIIYALAIHKSSCLY